MKSAAIFNKCHHFPCNSAHPPPRSLPQLLSVGPASLGPHASLTPLGFPEVPFALSWHLTPHGPASCNRGHLRTKCSWLLSLWGTPAFRMGTPYES